MYRVQLFQKADDHHLFHVSVCGLRQQVILKRVCPIIDLLEPGCSVQTINSIRDIRAMPELRAKRQKIMSTTSKVIDAAKDDQGDLHLKAGSAGSAIIIGHTVRY